MRYTEWMLAALDDYGLSAFFEIVRTQGFPVLARIAEEGIDVGLTTLFEFGLA